MIKYKMIDLCAGTGAFSYAFEKTNKVEIIFANDIEPSAKKIYDINFSHKLVLGDLHDIDNIDIPSHNILTCGFSCQPFSIAGKQLGFNDERSDILDYHEPEIIVLENVKNILNHNDGITFNEIIKNLTDRNYNVQWSLLNTSDITKIPQHRERVYIIGFKNYDIYNNFDFNFQLQQKNSIQSMLETNINNKYYYTPKSKIYDMLRQNIIKQNTIYQYRRVYVRENKNNECPTLTANMGEGGHNVPIILDNVGIRKLTPRECFNFQGFPLSYKLPDISDSKLYKLSGNAVTVSVVELIANKIISLLN